ncbi:MAG: response regulator transcription factor [Lachnospiraceae bacterium]|nr:response regulator transcription factor [Lachnospiraceae bacterium]
MNTYNIAICDDEPYSQMKIHKLLSSYYEEKGLECSIDLYSSGEELLKGRESRQKHDLIFLDIYLNGINGMDTAREIRKNDRKVDIIFITNYDSYVYEGYTVNAWRYLLKERMEEDIRECMDCVIKKRSRLEKGIEFVDGFRVIFLDDLVYVESQSHSLNFYVGEEKYKAFQRLDDLEKELAECGFLRIHKSFLVNVQYIQYIKNYRVYLTTGKDLPVPRARYQEVKKEFLRILK